MPDPYIAIRRQTLINLRDLLDQLVQSIDQMLEDVPTEFPNVREPTAWAKIEAVLKEKRVPTQTYNAIGQFFLKEENREHPVYNLTYDQFVSELFLSGGGRIGTLPRVGSVVIENLRWAFG